MTTGEHQPQAEDTRHQAWRCQSAVTLLDSVRFHFILTPQHTTRTRIWSDSVAKKFAVIILTVIEGIL
eukprot:scaffold116605_cov36-Prasinocladus_malaysianus.AAC.1